MQEEHLRLALLPFPLLNQRGAEGSVEFLPVVVNLLPALPHGAGLCFVERLRWCPNSARPARFCSLLNPDMSGALSA